MVHDKLSGERLYFVPIFKQLIKAPQGRPKLYCIMFGKCYLPSPILVVVVIQCNMNNLKFPKLCNSTNWNHFEPTGTPRRGPWGTRDTKDIQYVLWKCFTFNRLLFDSDLFEWLCEWIAMPAVPLVVPIALCNVSFKIPTHVYRIFFSCCNININLNQEFYYEIQKQF